MNFPFSERGEFRFVKALTAARNDFDHATCTLRARRIREPPPHPINGKGVAFPVKTIVQRHRGLTVLLRC